MLREEVDSLQNELDRHDQYSRRSCLVIDGITPIKNESNNDLIQRIKNLTTDHLKRNSVHPDQFDLEFDKCHRIGKVKDNKQAVIIKFKSDAFRERLYRARKSVPQGIRFRVSLTKRRIDLIENANKAVESIDVIKFAYADVNGNLKILLNQPLNGRWALPFNNLQELNELITEIDVHSAADQSSNSNLLDPQPLANGEATS